jgi:rubrerythrin
MAEEFVCNKCGYRCQLSEKKKKCPYCGEENTLEKEKQADELLESV